MRRLLSSMITILVLSSLFTCGFTSTAKVKSNETVTLTFMHYQSESQEIFTKIARDFEAANPNIKIEADVSGGDQYNTILQTKLASNEAPDIFGTHPGLSVAIQFAKAGYLEDLTNEPFMKGISPGVIRMGTYNNKAYALPIDAAYIATYYNKDIFAKYKLSIPKTWNEFLAVCEKLKKVNVTPIALGNKDLWVTQLIPYAMAPSVIYSKNIDFDKQMYDGKRKFNGPEWTKLMNMYLQLDKKGYFNKGQLSTNYDTSLALFAQGKTAMMIMGTWASKPIKDLNKNLKFGIFVTPASADGKNWTSSAVGGMLGISSTSKHKEEAKKFLSFFMKNYSYYINASGNFPVTNNVKLTDPVSNEFYLASKGLNTYNFLDQNWPAGVQDTMLKGFQEMFIGKPIKDVLNELDAEWATRVKQ